MGWVPCIIFPTRAPHACHERLIKLMSRLLHPAHTHPPTPPQVGHVSFGFPRDKGKGCPKPNPATVFSDLASPE